MFAMTDPFSVADRRRRSRRAGWRRAVRLALLVLDQPRIDAFAAATEDRRFIQSILS